jgi:hypothetical protein
LNLFHEKSSKDLKILSALNNFDYCMFIDTIQVDDCSSNKETLFKFHSFLCYDVNEDEWTFKKLPDTNFIIAPPPSPSAQP